MIHASMFLRRAIQADAIVSGAMAVLLTSAASTVAPLLNLPEVLLRESGLFLIAYAALVGWLGIRATIPKAMVWLIVVGNALWTVASIALLFSADVSPNLLGELFVAMQAIAVGAFAQLQYVGLRRSSVVATVEI